MTIRALRNLRRTVYREFKKAGGLYPMRLIIIEKGAIDPANVDAPTVDTETIHNFEGLQQTKRGYREEGLIAQSELRITIIGGSLPDGVFPNVGNYIEIDNNRREILEIISADSTGAVYEVRVK